MAQMVRHLEARHHGSSSPGSCYVDLSRLQQSVLQGDSMGSQTKQLEKVHPRIFRLHEAELLGRAEFQSGQRIFPFAFTILGRFSFLKCIPIYLLLALLSKCRYSLWVPLKRLH